MDNRSEWSLMAIGEKPLVRYAGMIALAVSLVISHTASAADDSVEPVSPTAEKADDGSSDDAEWMVERRIEEWMDGPGQALKQRDDLNVVQGTSLVVLRTDDERWAKARSLAFQNAYIQAMGKYVASIRQRTSVELIRNYFAEDIPESELRYQEGDAPGSYVERVVRKGAALLEHELDRKLAESGMSGDEIRRLTTPVQKRTALAESIKRRTLTEAFGSAAGLVPIKTFEEVDDEGNSAIGVVAVYSENMRRIADRVSKGKPIRPDPERARGSLGKLIASYRKDELPNEFGVRIKWDEQGYPAIVSFGQWGWSPSNLNKRKRALRRKFAMKQAANDARSNLVTFIRAATRFTEESNVGADMEEAFNLPRGGVPEEVEDSEITDKLVETARIKAEVALTGYRQERSWSARHPLLEGQEIVGMVAWWSPAEEDATRKTIGKEAKHAPSETTLEKQPKTRVSGGLESRDPDLADF